MKRPPVLSRAVDRGLAPFRGKRAAHLLPDARLGGPMPWVLAIMVALTVLAAGAALAVSNLTADARGELSGAATVQIIEADKQLRETQAEAAARILSNDPAVAGVRIIPREDIENLLSPWLGGTEEGMEVVPMPALIDINLRETASGDTLQRLSDSIAEVAPQSRIDAQGVWLAPVFDALTSLRLVALGLMVLLFFTGAAAVWLAARNALGSNRDTIEIVHLLGGNDNQIARVFQRSILADAVVGALVGLIIGVLAIMFLGRRFAALDSGMVAGGTLGTLDWILIALVPLFGVVLAVYTARMTVIGSLRRML